MSSRVAMKILDADHAITVSYRGVGVQSARAEAVGAYT
jgi:hypothetical protein